jgi:hypothetical protein
VTVEAPLPPRPADVRATLGRAGLDDLVRERRIDESELHGIELSGFPCITSVFERAASGRSISPEPRSRGSISPMSS